MSNYNPFSLEGKTILVTGASSGIGQTTAVECSKLGARLVITGRNVERLEQTFNQLDGEGHKQIIAELTNNDDVKRLVEECPELNGLVLCAGKGKTLPLSFATLDKMYDMFNVNFFAPHELLRSLLKKKRFLKDASIVFISSIGGVFSHNIGNGMYGSSKAALNSLMQYYANELAPKKIRVNSVNPGMTNTRLIQRGEISAEQLEHDKLSYPLKRYGEPNDIAYGVIYLLSDASSWVTGHSLVIDGGVSI